MGWAKVWAGATLAAMSGLAARYLVQQDRVERSWLESVGPKLSAIGEVEHLSILPLVERLSPDVKLDGEPGVSYLVRADGTNLLSDTGLNAWRRAQSALVGNAATLRVDLQALDGVVISHLHTDHVGGVLSQLRRTFSFSASALEARGLPAYVPTPMRHDRADIVLTTGPRVIAQGVAVLPPLPRMLFWLGPVAEQALVVNVRGFGLVLVSGCGHPGIERMLAATERVLDVPIRAVVGGLHLPVHPLGTPLVAQAILGSPHWPWRPIGERDVAEAIAEISARGPRIVALSSARQHALDLRQLRACVRRAVSDAAGRGRAAGLLRMVPGGRPPGQPENRSASRVGQSVLGTDPILVVRYERRGTVTWTPGRLSYNARPGDRLAGATGRDRGSDRSRGRDRSRGCHGVRPDAERLGLDRTILMP